MDGYNYGFMDGYDRLWMATIGYGYMTGYGWLQQVMDGYNRLWMATIGYG